VIDNLQRLYEWHAAHPVGTVRGVDIEALRQAAPEIKRLRAALADAAEDVASWSSYADKYFREKHDLAGAVERYKKLSDGGES